MNVCTTGVASYQQVVSSLSLPAPASRAGGRPAEVCPALPAGTSRSPAAAGYGGTRCETPALWQTLDHTSSLGTR